MTRSPMPLLAVRLALVLCVTSTLAAQCPPGAPMPLDLTIETTTPEQGPAHTRWRAGTDAMAQNDLPAARTHLLAALEFHPSSPAILFDLMLAAGADPDQQALEAERFARATCDAQGRLKIDTMQKRRIAARIGLEAGLEQARVLAGLRAAAINELARFVDRNKPQSRSNAARALLVRWAAELLLVVGRGAPGMLGSVSSSVDKTQRAFAPDYELVLQGLAKVMRQKPRPATPDAPATGPATGPATDPTTVRARAIRAARILGGLQRQGAFKDLKGPPPHEVGALADEALRLLDEHAAALAKGKVWTIQELEQLTPADAAKFTAEHASWDSAGHALSATGRYRIETVCGHTTLLAAARTIEQHHARLADHFGSDPFGQRPGIVRIVPEHCDLETEGSPYWWAGGFQAGDTTTVRFAWGNIPALGRTLTHELTHRFDGVLRPFLGAWYGEGHAQWTAAHYAKMSDPTCVEAHLEVHPPAHTWYKGYGAAEEFEKLLKGTVEDYRDNYFAGYSLYAFLRAWPIGAPHYREALGLYERNARAGQKDPVAWFTRHFCDGKQGRPAALEGLLTEWQTFLRGCYEWQDDKKDGNEWVGKIGRRGPAEPAPLVLDAPTWSWARERAEPWFGQDHAAAATLLLHEAGDVEATIAAGVWSCTVDGWRADTSRALLDALRAGKAADAASAFAAITMLRFPLLEARPGAQPAGSLRALRALLDGLATRARALSTAGATLAAAALAAEHDDLARLCGLPPLAAATAAAPAASPATQPRHLGDHGFAESDLTDYQDLRTPGLWYATPEGDLHVGRERPREATGTMDRTAHHRDAFVHTVAWQRPGCYVLRGRVHFTTSYVRGCIVFGHTRADRDLRLQFSAGDYRYAIGKQENDEGRGELGLVLRGLWERDGHMPNPTGHRALPLPAEQAWFDYVLHVRGPRVLVEINGEAVMHYAVHDGSPIEGHVGFAMSVGAIRVQQPTIQRLDHAGSANMGGLDLGNQPTGTLEELLLLPVHGLPVAANGTLVLWLPKVADGDGSPGDRLAHALPALANMRLATHDHPHRWLLAVPREMTADDRKAALEHLQHPKGAPMTVVEHDVGAPFTGSVPWVLFVDGEGVLRAAAAANETRLDTQVRRWSRLFRGR